MAKKYNTSHLIHIFNIRDDVTVAILAKSQAVNNASKIKTPVIDISHEN